MGHLTLTPLRPTQHRLNIVRETSTLNGDRKNGFEVAERQICRVIQDMHTTPWVRFTYPLSYRHSVRLLPEVHSSRNTEAE